MNNKKHIKNTDINKLPECRIFEAIEEKSPA